MRIVVDLQACQSSGSRHRGIGRYSLSLVKAMLQQARGHEMILMLNGLFHETIDPIRTALADVAGPEHFVVWNTPGPVAAIPAENAWRNRAAEYVREQFLASLRPDIVHVSSLFEGGSDDAITSIGKSAHQLPTAVTLYDLIPLIHAQHYLQNPQVEQWYFDKLRSIKRADLLLAISESSRQEAINYLQFAPDSVVNISSAVDSHFRVPDDAKFGDTEGMSALRHRCRLRREFVMYTGGIDLRKNIEGLIAAYANLPLGLRVQHQLVIVCSVDAEALVRMLALARQHGLYQDEIVFTGFVTDDELRDLYQACKLFVFPSWHEGFGLPALEAMACGAPVIAANSSSLPEVIDKPEALFEARSTPAMTQKIQQVLTQPIFRESLRQHGLRQAAKFSWDETAKRAIAGFEALHARRSSSEVFYAQQPQRYLPKLAFFTPLPDLATGIAKYSEELLPELAQYYEITIIVAQEKVENQWLTTQFRIHDATWFEQHAFEFDRLLYHFGNSPLHRHMHELFPRFPGVLVLHDFFFGDSLAHMELSKTAPHIWSKALFDSHGYQPFLDMRGTNVYTSTIQSYPACLSLVDQSHGVIVHSLYTKNIARQWCRDVTDHTWQIVPLISQAPVRKCRVAARKKLGIESDAFLVCSFGMLGANKRNQALLAAWLQSSLASNKSCHLIFVGQADVTEYGQQLQMQISASEDADRIRITGYVDDAHYQSYLEAADLGVQLRATSRGESSKAVLDCMAYGLPTIINRNGPMAEIPDSVALCLEDDFTVDALQQALENLLENPQWRVSMSQRGHAYVLDVHKPKTVAQSYAKAIEGFYKHNLNATFHQIRRTIAALPGPRPDVDTQIVMAKHLVENQIVAQPARILVDVGAMLPAPDCDQEHIRANLEFLLSVKSAKRMEFIRCVDGIWHVERSEIFRALMIEQDFAEDSPIEFHWGDVYVRLSDFIQPQKIADAMPVFPLGVKIARRCQDGDWRIEFLALISH